MKQRSYLLWILVLAGGLYGADGTGINQTTSDLITLASGWRGEVVAVVDQSFCGWSLTIGDADNDGKNEILTTGSPDSRLDYYKKVDGKWQFRELARNLAQETPGMGLTVQIVDLNKDGQNEIILGTGQDAALTCAKFYILQTNGSEITHKISSASFLNGSAYTHNFGVYDIDGDGIKEVLTAYCGSGEITRYDVNKEMTAVERRHLLTHPGSGEDAMIADVDNDGKMEFISCDSFRKDAGKVLIFDFDGKGELILPARIVMTGYDEKRCFHANIAVGDLNNDGKNELIVCWKQQERVNQGTIIVYDISGNQATPISTLMKNDPRLDLSYCERMMIVGDADNDDQNELIVTTRGEREWGGQGLANIFMFKIRNGSVKEYKIGNFLPGKADSVWPAVGDVDNDGKNEIILATGIGSRKRPGESHVIALAFNKNKHSDQTFAINSDCRIVLEETAKDVEQTASRELMSHLSKMLGRSIPQVRVTGNSQLQSGDIVIGTPKTSELVKRFEKELSLAEIKNDGYIVESIVYQGSRVLVIASNEPRGVLYGVYGLLEALGGNVFSESIPLPRAVSFTLSSPLRKEAFFSHRAGGITDGILKFWDPVSDSDLEAMWKWYARNGLNAFMYHSMAGNYPDHPEMNAFLGTGLGSYIYFSDYPKLAWKEKNGPMIEKARLTLDTLVRSGAKWGVDIILSFYEPGYPEGLLEAYPEIRGKRYPCPANPYFWSYIENVYRELFKDFPGLKGVIFTTGENIRGNLVNAICDDCCGTSFNDFDNWKTKQWERPALLCRHINTAIKSVRPDALVIYRPHLFDMTLGDTSQKMAKWDPYVNNPRMQAAIPKDVVILRRPHDHDYVSNAGHNQFMGAGLGPQPEGILLSGGGEYRGKMTIPCAEIEEFSEGKGRVPYFASKNVNTLIIATAFYMPAITGPSGCMGIDNMNNDHFAQLAWDPFKPAERIWADWAKRYFPGVEKEMIAIMKPSYRMMYRLGYETDFDVRGTRYSFPRAMQKPRNPRLSSVEAAQEAYQIAESMYTDLATVKDKVGPKDYAAVKKYFCESKKLHLFWLNYIRANYYYQHWDEKEFRSSLIVLRDITPTLDFPICPWIDVWRDCITAPISYQENGAKFIANVASRLPDNPDYAWPIIDVYSDESFHRSLGRLSRPPYITALLIDEGSGIDFDSLTITHNGKRVSSSEYAVIKNMLLSNPSFERGLKEFPDEWVPSDDRRTARYQSIRRGDGTEHSGQDCIMIDADKGKNYWMTKTQILVDPDTEYRFSCWIRTQAGKESIAFISAFEYDKDGKVVAEHAAEDKVKDTCDWVENRYTFRTTAATEKVVLRLNLIGGGQVWFDDVVFAAVSEKRKTDTDLLVLTLPALSMGLHEVSINVGDKAGNKAPTAKISFEIVQNNGK